MSISTHEAAKGFSEGMAKQVKAANCGQDELERWFNIWWPEWTLGEQVWWAWHNSPEMHHFYVHEAFTDKGETLYMAFRFGPDWSVWQAANGEHMHQDKETPIEDLRQYLEEKT